MDWFSSNEIWIEAGVAAVSFYLFIMHMLTTAEERFVSAALFKDRNFGMGSALGFVFGLVLFATLALMPPLLQDLLNYPVMTTGLVTAPRGAGTLIAMFIVGRIAGKVDVRLIIGVGFALAAFPCWQMTGFDLQMDAGTVVWSGFVQGIGIGLIYVALSTATFATLKASLRNEGTAIFSLGRNIGSSIGISVVETLLTRNTQIMHATLAEHVTAFSPIVRAQLHGGSPTCRRWPGLNATVTGQAAIVAYNNNFQLLMYCCLAAIPLVLLLRKAGAVPPSR